MGYANFSELKQVIPEWVGRNDARFVVQVPRFVSIAEARIFFGSRETVPTDGVRVRQMEATASLTPTADPQTGVLSSPLPERYLSMRRVYSGSDFNRTFQYLSPQVFWTDVRVSPGSDQTSFGFLGWPRIYTIEQDQIHVAPAGDGTIEMLYYAAFPTLSDDTDTNWLLQNTDVYFFASMAEAWRYSRNQQQVQSALTSYAGLVSGLNGTEQKGRRSGQVLAPETVPGYVSDRGYWG